eukprot:s3524_g13.t1
MTLLLPLRQRLRRGFQQIERARRRAPTLLVVDDEAGAVAADKDVRKLFGELLEHTCQLHILILSRAPIYHSLGPTKVVNVPLSGLKEPDAAKLFLQRIHRMLDDRDFPDPVVGNADAGGGTCAIRATEKADGEHDPSSEGSSFAALPWRPSWEDPRGRISGHTEWTKPHGLGRGDGSGQWLSELEWNTQGVVVQGHWREKLSRESSSFIA